MNPVQFNGIYKLCLWRNPEKGYNNTDELNNNAYDANFVVLKQMKTDAERAGRKIELVEDNANYYWFEDDALGNDASAFDINTVFPSFQSVNPNISSTPHKLDVLVEDKEHDQLRYKVMDKAWGDKARQLLDLNA